MKNILKQKTANHCITQSFSISRMKFRWDTYAELRVTVDRIAKKILVLWQRQGESDGIDTTYTWVSIEPTKEESKMIMHFRQRCLYRSAYSIIQR
jgi:hypothetical protein